MAKQPMHEAATSSGIGRMSLDKRYHGELDATGLGEMFAAMTTTPGSAGYVAMELVDDGLQGRRGTFFLQHSGTADRGAPQLSVTVVPDSGTGELVASRAASRSDRRGQALLRLRLLARSDGPATA